MKTIGWLLKNKNHSGDVWGIVPDATVLEALAILAERNIGALMVMTGEKLVGIISERDYARKVALNGKSSKTTIVREIMTSPVYTITAENTLSEGMRVMSDNHIRHLPVLADGKVVGMVSIGDLIKAVMLEQASIIDHLKAYIRGGSVAG